MNKKSTLRNVANNYLTHPKTSNGITLIALVITIIVLLILAGISISMLSGNNGLLKRAGQARDETIVGQEKEQINLAYMAASANKLGKSVTQSDMQNELDLLNGDTGKTEANKKTKVTGSSTFNIHYNETNHNYTVNNGSVTRIADGEIPQGGEGDWIAAWVQTSSGWDSTTYHSGDKTDEELASMGTIVAKLYNTSTENSYKLEINGIGEMKDLGYYDIPVSVADQYPWMRYYGEAWQDENLSYASRNY